MRPRTRGEWIAGVAASAAGIAAGTARGSAQTLRPIVISEPVHQIGYTPLYLAIDQGLFAKRGFAVSTLTASNGAHVTALVSGQVWGSIGGPESDAMANARGNADPLLSVCNCVNRANNYLMARTGLAPKSNSPADMKAFLRGKKFALSRYGGTPDNLGRWYLEKLGLDLKTDVTIINNGDASEAPNMVKSGAADIAITAEPQLTYGKLQGVWGEPFFSFPSLGDYAYSVISVRKSTVAKEPQVVNAFVAAMIEALKLTATNRAVVEATARKEFPTLPAVGMKAALDRAYADSLWSKDGIITQQGYDLDMSVVYAAGEFNQHMPFADVVDMQFVTKHPAGA